ncbi:Protein of unknown function [Pyronema omphalodes CBS 100304]|uniref:Uncharacterized protein n=1 Tax=Pyronema omphalodes (strain CBS 100304) TaxID=1076935 RepID=U4L6D4_PYROM|nr:Protein of unknown function [Pyronema omphalodes CBS 100304]
MGSSCSNTNGTSSVFSPSSTSSFSSSCSSFSALPQLCASDFRDSMDAGFNAAQTVIVDGAECTMKAIEGDIMPMKEYLKRAEVYWSCIEQPEDCGNATGKGEK